MSRNNLFSCIPFRLQKESNTSPSWHAQTASVHAEQPTSPDAPSTERVVKQPHTSPGTVKLRGGGMGNLCCGL
ncbi:hypothetical protein N7492_006318 [Penicillium capsulatum]|uniref:Uncharacterized protein n=1 Tax=Penicillium capsulatum TaxID=69766 RepID=A0A9W9I6R9_9EURO|nr:hypothetical protein N7492_006318 [Penicillium capsulatum]KAJ6108966.1 hypothetical protein N7512_008803 [Penicillium capsulatum]